MEIRMGNEHISFEVTIFTMRRLEDGLGELAF